jgi:hypothetical protein
VIDVRNNAMLRILFIDGRLTEQASHEVYDRQRPSQTAATLTVHLLGKILQPLK